MFSRTYSAIGIINESCLDQAGSIRKQNERRSNKHKTVKAGLAQLQIVHTDKAGHAGQVKLGLIPQKLCKPPILTGRIFPSPECDRFSSPTLELLINFMTETQYNRILILGGRLQPGVAKQSSHPIVLRWVCLVDS